MAKKHFDQTNDFAYEEVIPENGEGAINPKMFGGLIPQFVDNYEPMDLVQIREDLGDKTKKLIDDIIKVYYKMDDSGNPDIKTYLEQASKIETMTLQSLLFQVKSSEHVLYSLMNRLNATGSVDNSLYKLISETQEKSLSLTMQVSNYFRSLPSYFKQLRFELETNIDMVTVMPTQEMIEQQNDGDDPDNFVKKPQRGMRNLLRNIEEMENQMMADGETITENIDLPNKDYKIKEVEIVDGVSEDELKRQLLADNEE